MKLLTWIVFLQDEKRQNVANPGFAGIKKWVEVFLLSGGSGLWVPADKDDSFDANVQLSALIKNEFEKLKSVFMNSK